MGITGVSLWPTLYRPTKKRCFLFVCFVFFCLFCFFVCFLFICFLLFLLLLLLLFFWIPNLFWMFIYSKKLLPQTRWKNLIFFLVFYRLYVYDVILTSHGNLWCLFWLILIEEQDLCLGTKDSTIGSLYRKYMGYRTYAASPLVKWNSLMVRYKG